ncbi:ABC-F type ribosomal protection protein [Vagococcus sp. BWB3-3]|uniref:ABC-F type ribosomal protection protein n=1 Tax=Vagococcus allomyrinae TaxID=2794353 RepID=A0A940PE20_9ENTE|nr:ABC-F type ribosomal protection protein [Vagococcus allomyrinae]MBP1041781.1 ABC-F type ribosomal protection protein [Vagococcus allomyrinae]
MQLLSVDLKDVALTLGGQQVLELQQLSIYQGDKIGIVGNNGQGKTTLLNVLRRILQPDKGTVVIKTEFALFEQVTLPEERLADYEWLSKFKVPKQASSSFSGGEQTRMKLAQLFSDYHEGLLLDEPTTHLDQEGITFLVDELVYYYGTLVVVSHDRYFLDKTVTKIWELANGRVTEYQGNYTAYQLQKEAEEQANLTEQKNNLKEKRRLELAIADKKAKADKLAAVTEKQKKRQIKPSRLGGTKQKDSVVKGIQKSAKAMEKRLSQLAVGPSSQVEKKIIFKQSAELTLHNNYPIMGEGVTLKKGKRLLLDNADFQFSLGEVIVLNGPNGCGKSSLLAHIMSKGQGIVVSPKVMFGNFDQHAYQVVTQETLGSYLAKGTDYPEAIVRSVVHQLGFSQNDLTKRVCDLSGGERTRLILGELFLKESNVLLLDEPTNFIDLASRLALENFINGYPGTILLTSHDRYFVERVGTQNWLFKNQKLVME